MNDFIFFVQPDYIGYFWLIVSLLFLFAELGTPGLFFFISFAVGSCFASVAAFVSVSFFSQCLIALFFSIVAFFVLRYYFSLKKQKTVKTNVDALVGKVGVVTKRVEPNKTGLIKVKGEIWTVEVDDEIVLEKEAVVRVIAVKGNRLIVKQS